MAYINLGVLHFTDRLFAVRISLIVWCCLQELLEVASDAMPFSTDEDGAQPSGINPLASVYDLGKDPMDYHEDRVRFFSLFLSLTFRINPRSSAGSKQ